MISDAPTSGLEPEMFPIANGGDKRVPFFALVIGIDDYAMVKSLTGAAGDAKDIVRYLRSHLKVPKGHIVMLQNRAATRDRIIQAFSDLQRNPDINRDDAIFIYFAGHGSEAYAPLGWDSPGSKVQVILPQDVDMPDPSGAPIPPIPDRTWAVLLDELARHKGNNITVVFDCCHSSSGTRGDENVPERVARVATLKHPLPKNLDYGLMPAERSRAMNTPSVFSESNLRSHVLMAACGAEESAYENTKLGRGAFTTALIQTLTTAGVDKLTYTGLMDRLPNLPKQNPQCEGYHRDRMLFNARLPGAHRFFIGVEKHEDEYRLKAGTAQGMTVGSEFTIHADHTSDAESNPPLVRMRSKEVFPFRTTLEFVNNPPAVAMPLPAYAREVLSGPGRELRVHFSKKFRKVVSVEEIRQEMHGSGESVFGFIVSQASQAEMLVDIKSTKAGPYVVFTTANPLVKQYKFGRLRNVVEPTAEAVSRVLHAAATWNYHFKRTSHTRFGGLVEMEFFHLGYVTDNIEGDDRHVLKPVGKNLNVTGFVDMVVDPDQFFGVKLVNKSNVDLYPYLFYFDIRQQSIEPYYLSSTGKQWVDPPLRANSYHTIGYGTGGEVPFAFFLQPGEDFDLGFLKLFLTTEPIEFDSLKQSSPFDTSRAAFPRTDVLHKLRNSERGAESWSTAVTTVVQRSRPRRPIAPLISPLVVSFHTHCKQWLFEKVLRRLLRLFIRL